MTPPARIRAAIEILDAIIAAARRQGPPADRLIAEWFRTHRFAGSKDKRAIREHVYAAIRACGPVPVSGRAAMLGLVEEQPEMRDLFDGSQYGPAPISAGETVAAGGIAPEWLEDRLIASGVSAGEAAALLERAPLDLRINTLRTTHEALTLPEPLDPLPSANGLRAPAGTSVEQWPAYAEGLVEIQDCGSQLACEAVGALPGETVLDLCAGAGGKTLALAAAMRDRGVLLATDTDRRRLARLAPRAVRADVNIVQTVLLDPGRELMALEQWQGKIDRVLIDAPCSGTGTWRRNPEARWRLTERDLARLIALQDRLLAIAAQLLRPGGSLTYVTCSLLDEEGAGQIDGFLQDNPGWQADPPGLPLGVRRGAGVRLTPAGDRTDGFFIARLGKPW